MKKIVFMIFVVLMVILIYVANVDRKVYYLALGDSSKYIIDSKGNKVKGYSFYVQEYLKEKKVLEKYVHEFALENERIPDLMNAINDNHSYKKITLKNSLIKADLVTLSVSIEDVFAKLSDQNINYAGVYDYVDELILDLEKLFGLIREYCKENILFIGTYNPYNNDSNAADVIYYINEKYKSACKKYDIKFVDISFVSSEVLNNDRYNLIGQKVIKISDKVLFSA